MALPPVHLHLGAHKTATTHLQRGLDQNASTLTRSGVLFLGPRTLRTGAIRPGHVISSWRPAFLWRRRLVPELAHQCLGVDRLVLSEENILGSPHDPALRARGQFYPTAARRLRKFLRATGIESVHLFLAVRDPATFMVSAYCQWLFAGGHTGFEAFTRGLDPAALRWSDLVARLGRVPGVAGCTLWRYEDYPACRKAVLARMLTPGLSRSLPDFGGRMQAGLSARAHDAVAAWERAGRSPPAGMTLALEARQRWPKADGAPGITPYPEAVLERSAAAYDADMRAMAALPRVRVIGNGDVAEALPGRAGPETAGRPGEGAGARGGNA